MTNTNQTMETSKNLQYSVEAIIKKINNGQILFNHPAQREADQWSPKMKSNLISDILQGNPMPELVMAEQIINGVSYIWNLDGKQRCTNVYAYMNDEFKINKATRRTEIKYIAAMKENGHVVKDSNGIQLMEWRTFDITNKKFSQLPMELQDKIREYCFNVVLYLNCSSEDITYHIERYNDGKPMTKSQKGIIRLGEFADKVKSISNMDFFSDCGAYTVKENKNGTINRVVAETIMAEYFLNDWKKNQEDMCSYLNENADATMFDDFEDEVSTLTEIVESEHDELWTSKDSFIWFTVFHRAMESGVSEEEFSKFMTLCVGDYRTVDVNGNTLESLATNRNTKDKSVILLKINHLMTLLNKSLGKEVAA